MLSSNALRGVLSAIAAVSVSVPSALAGDGVPPRILLIDPAPGGGIVDQVGLANVTLTFSESIIPGAAPVAAWGVASGSIPVTTIYNPALNQLSVVLVPPAKTDRVTLYVLPSVTDVSGEPLDGEIAVPVAGFLPSGDGVAGGVAAFRYDILQGDVDGDGVTDAVDASLVLAALGACNGDAGFESSADLNADGCVNVFDVQIVLSGLGDALPALDGTPPVIGAISRADGAPLTADLEDLAITFSEPLESLSILPGLLEIRSIDGDVYVPATTSLSPDGLTVVAHFAPPLSSCGNYTVRVGNALADLSGELFLPPATAPSFAGSTPPPVPTLGAYPSATKSNGVTMSGTVPDAVGYADAESVRIQGPDLVVTAPVGAGGSFSTTVPLKQNVINYLYVSAISPCGVAGPPTVATVTQDTTGPNLTIQFPSSARIAKGQFFEDAINVGGTVGDTLSGFEGLTVTVNGQPAVVDIGLGQNGTWVRGNVPLNPAGVPTPIEVVATDILGNTSTASISVTKSAPPRNAAFLEALSGDDQSGTVDTTLRQPIRVQLWKADGTPFANKVVDFRVTQNDGRLSPADGGSGFGSGTMFFQTFTDASGVAAAMWTLGGTAGCGNNRVEVIAKDVAGVALFSATAFAAEPDQINIGSGNNQRVETGGVAPLPLSAWVSDSCNPVAGVPVTFTVTQGDGLVNGQTQVTVPSLPTGHADVTFTAGTTPGANRVEATYQGNETNPAVFTTYGIERDFTKPTSFHGLVLDNASRPIGNVGISLKFQDTIAASTFTSAQGQFEFPDLNKDGAVHVIVQGVFANKLNGQPLPAGVKFPSLGYEASIVPNAENTLGRPILLPPLLQTNAVVWNGQNDIELTCAGIEGLKFTVKAGSMTLENGSKPTVNAPVTLSLNQVHHDDIPMPMPNGVAPAFAWTFQPANATFDPPVTVEYPNMSVLPPGATAYFLTFNHDLGEFEIMAPGRVSEDGSVIVTEEGTGLSLSGWGCNCPPYAVTGDCCKCDSSAEGVTSLELADSDFQIWAPPLVWGPWVPVFSHGGPFQVTIEYEPQGDTTVFGEVRWQACKVSEDKCGTGGCEQKEVPFFGIWGGKTCDAWANVWVRFRGVPFGSVVDGSVSTSGSTCNPCGSQGAASADDAIGGFAGATWTVTGAGQSTTANPGGSFRLENLNAVDLFGPSGQGSPADGLSDDALRVVATGMTTGGSLTYAYSNLFKLPQGGEIQLEEFTFSDIPPSGPESLTLSAAQEVVAVGTSSQLTAIGAMNTGGSEDLTGAASGTKYISSNQAVAIVDADGRLTAFAVGSVFITASNASVTAVKRIDVTAEAIAVTLTGGVRLASGDIVAGASVTTTFGGKVISVRDGSFQLPVTVPVRASTFVVLAQAEVGGVPHVGSVSVPLASVAGLVDVGEIVLVPFNQATLYGPSQLAVGDQPLFVRVADVNGDGRLDIITANAGSNDLTIRFGTEDGTFSESLFLAMGDTPRSVDVADVSGDGIPDLISAGAGGVMIRLGVGGGAFGAPNSIDLGLAPHTVVAADLDGDGDLDLAASNPASNSLTVALNLGRGEFGRGESLPFGLSPERLIALDVDLDNDIDLLTSNFDSDRVSLRRNRGAAAFAMMESLPMGDGTSDLVAIDLDGDADIDLATSNYWSGDLAVRLNEGGGVFGSPAFVPSGVGASAIASGDLDLDGDIDLVVCHYNSGTVALHWNDGSGGFKSRVIEPAGAAPSDLAIGDLNSDGLLDIVVTNATTATVTLILGGNSGGVGATDLVEVLGSPVHVASGDINGDGYSDLAVANRSQDQVAVLLSDGLGGYELPQALDMGESPSRVVLDDIDSDGDLDLLAVHPFLDALVVRRRGAGGSWGAPEVVAAGESPSDVVIGDVTGDGLKDLVIANPDLDLVVLRQSLPGGTFGPPVQIAVGDGPRSLALADLDADGDADLVTGNYWDKQMRVLLNNGNATFVQSSIALAERPDAVAIGDLNGDGAPDLVYASRGADVLGIMFATGGSFSAAVPVPTSLGPTALLLDDFDGDGDVDIAAACGEAGVLAIHLASLEGTYGEHWTFVAGPSCESIAAIRTPGSARPDLCSAIEALGAVSILRQSFAP